MHWRQRLTAAYDSVASKFSDAKTNWNIVTGSSAALHAPFRRIGWIWSSARAACDENLRTWDFLLDPPPAVASAMKGQVRAARSKDLATMLPGLVPERGDFGCGSSDNGQCVFDFASTLKPLVNGKACKLKDTAEWNRSHAPSLLSALSRGQWTQTRRARLKKRKEDHG